MSKLVISGYYGFGNAGDEAMLSAMLTALRSLDPALQITVISGSPGDTRQRYGVMAIHRLNLPAIALAVSRADLLVSGGGSLLQDVTSGRSIFYYLAILKLANLLSCPIMLYAQGIGPIRSGLARSFMRHIGNRIAGGTVRDEGSLSELADLGVNLAQVSVTADPVLALERVSLDSGREILGQLEMQGEGPLIGFSVREWQGREHFKTVFAAVADRLVIELGARILFLPMQCPDDLEAAQLVAERMNVAHALIGSRSDTVDLLSIVGNLDLLVGVRLHALIFAAVMETPFIGVSYDPKIDRFLESLGEQSAGSLDSLTEQNLYQHIIQSMGNQPAMEERRRRLSELRRQAVRNAERAIELMRKEV